MTDCGMKKRRLSNLESCERACDYPLIILVMLHSYVGSRVSPRMREERAEGLSGQADASVLDLTDG